MMGPLTTQLAALVQVCDEDERDLIEKMVFSAANYVQEVVHMEATAMNYAGRDGEELREAVSKADRNRTGAHNALISSVDIVNRICGFHDLPPLYTGDAQRRHYGDFALELVNEIFTQRR